jgi:L-rhamnose mutarotase
MSSLKEKYHNKEGYYIDSLSYPTKRICLALDLKNDPGLIAEYRNYHSPANYWKRIGHGIRKAGIAVMDIYLVDNRMFMICEIPVERDFEEVWKAMGQYEGQNEWEKLMAKFQQALPGHKLEWVKMEKVYEIPPE